MNNNQPSPNRVRQSGVMNHIIPGVGGHTNDSSRIGIRARPQVRAGGAASLAPLKRVNKSAPSNSMQHAQLAHENGGMPSNMFPEKNSPILESYNSV